MTEAASKQVAIIQFIALKRTKEKSLQTPLSIPNQERNSGLAKKFIRFFSVRWL